MQILRLGDFAGAVVIGDADHIEAQVVEQPGLDRRLVAVGGGGHHRNVRQGLLDRGGIFLDKVLDHVPGGTINFRCVVDFPLRIGEDIHRQHDVGIRRQDLAHRRDHVFDIGVRVRDNLGHLVVSRLALELKGLGRSRQQDKRQVQAILLREFE